ncbi:MAG: response regulator [Bacteroidetes bacterium]|nr:response regulator [Bacteroidota bacterium]
MKFQRVVYLILSAYFIGNFALIYIQYNSSKNIKKLINGNTQLLSEYKINSELKELEKNILLVDRKISQTITTQDTAFILGADHQISSVTHTLEKLQRINDNDTSVRYIQELNRLVHQKLTIEEYLIADFFNNKDQKLARKRQAAQRMLSDTIMHVVQKIVDTRQIIQERTTNAVDLSGEKALSLSTLLIIIVLISGAFLFWFIVNNMRKQNSLIAQLDTSEKSAKAAAVIKEKFLANMSHEIRTPLNAIIGFTSLLKMKKLDNEASEYTQTIHEAGENLLTIVNDILDLSKIEAGMIRIELIPFNLHSVLHSIQNLYRAKLNDKHLKFKIKIDDHIPQQLIGDPTRLTQILSNLMNNAIKFTEAGSIGIQASLLHIIDQNAFIDISISDTGIGIPKDKLQLIFKRFQQAEDATNRKYGGTGLGLSIVQDLVTIQQGTISVESEVHQGTTFRIQIPYKIAPAEPLDQHEEDLSNECLPASKQARVLAVDDNHINRRLLQQLFLKNNIALDLAESGKEAISLLKLNPYVLVLMDVQMPEMNGFETTAIIRNDLRLQVPIIAMTARAMPEERERCISHGMNDHIAKPFSEQDLFKLINHYTSIHQHSFRLIDVQHIHEISNGDSEFEIRMTDDFIEMVSVSMEQLESAWHQKKVKEINRLAHDLKSTISIFGLNTAFDKVLDPLEQPDLNEVNFWQLFYALSALSKEAIFEAKQFRQLIQSA